MTCRAFVSPCRGPRRFRSRYSSRFKDLFGVEIDEGYGLTETAPTLTSNRMMPKPKPGSVGRPLPGVELRIINEAGDDVELGDPGEIIVRGPNVFKGYWNQPEETERLFWGDWFRTGDIALQDEEGYIHLVDRKRDLVIVSGFNVFPSEVEAALLANPKIAEAAVVGIPHEYRGETLKAYVVLEQGAEATEEELLEDVAKRLARFKCPETIDIVAELPHLLTGKVMRRLVARRREHSGRARGLDRLDTFLPSQLQRTSATNGFESAGSENPHLATLVVEHPRGLEHSQGLARAFAAHSCEASEIALSQRKVEVDRSSVLAPQQLGQT